MHSLYALCGMHNDCTLLHVAHVQHAIIMCMFVMMSMTCPLYQQTL